MNNKNPDPQVSLLKWMIEDVRKVTLKGVEHLSKEQLFQTPVEGEYSIGSYLMHLGEVDISWLEVISGKEQPAELKEKAYFDKWYDPSTEASPPKEPMELSEYLEILETTRKNFLDYISSLKDSDLEENITRMGSRGEFTRSKKWIIYHILEHEAHHRGQMFMLIRKAGWKKI